MASAEPLRCDGGWIVPVEQSIDAHDEQRKAIICVQLSIELDTGTRRFRGSVPRLRDHWSLLFFGNPRARSTWNERHRVLHGAVSDPCRADANVDRRESLRDPSTGRREY
jgi:hypothetical protein